MATRSLAVAMILVTLVLCSDHAWSQAAAGPSGHWEGAIQLPGQELKIEVDLANTAGTWDGRISIPAQNLKGFPLSSITVQGDSVSFAMKGIPGDPGFKGTLSKDLKTLSGEFTQGGGSIPFALTRTGEAKIDPLPKSTPVAKELEGSWEASLDVGGKILRLALKLSNQPDGAATGTLVSVDQGGAEIPISAVIQSGTQLRLLLPVIAGQYEGELTDGQLKGTWTQGSKTLPLVFKRSK